jgi:DNA helicase-2/ATP-dependent DNA helicase PcrA
MTIASRTGILEEFENPTTIEDQNRYQNLQELLNGIKDFTTRFEGEGAPTLQDYIENISLMTDADMEDEDDKNRVSLMTMHSAKGLEFKEVYLAGIEEGLFPSQMAMNTEKELEEERRLFYVALTRAEEKATISYANNRYKWGVSNPARPSRFINDLDPSYLVFPDYSTDNNDEDFSFSAKSKQTETYSSTPSKRKLKKIDKSASGKAAAPSEKTEYKGDLKVGMKVEHSRFGKGVIMDIENAMPDTKARIAFENNGEKRLLLKYAKLKIIS